MSIVSSEVSSNNPVTQRDVEDALSLLGLTIRDKSELQVHTQLLAAAYDVFEKLEALPEYHLPIDLDKYPRNEIRKVEAHENQHGSAWSYRCSARKQSSSGVSTTGLLSGRTVVVKDNVGIAGVPQTDGTDALPPRVAKCDSTVVTRILDAGGHVVGTATCEAWSCATVSNTAAEGPVFNPWAHGYSAGGSSSGVAALVGARRSKTGQLQTPTGGIDVQGQHPVVDMGIGGDQGGSIRVPAAFCGLVGLKPTHGLVPYTGVTACEPVLDHIGPMCRTVEDAAVLLEVIAGTDNIDDRQLGAPAHGEVKYSAALKDWYGRATREHPGKPLSGRRAAILAEGIDAPFVKDAMKEELKATAAKFESLGAVVEQVSMPWHDTGRSLWMAICRQSLTSIALGNPMGRRGYYPTEFFKSALPWTQEKWEKLPIAMRNELINGTFEKERFPGLYAKCMNLTLKLKQEYEDLFKIYDVLILPSVPFTAPRLFDRSTASVWDVISSTFGQTLNTMQFNLTGHPAMSIPTSLQPDMSGADPNTMLPVSAQIVGPLFGESKILEFGFAFEKAYDWECAA